MLSRSEPQPAFSGDAIRQFLLGRLPGKDQSVFERALFLDSELEQRTRLEEIALADEYAKGKLRGKDLTAFIETFPFSSARRNQIEVSTALRECFAPETDVHRAPALLTLKHPVWKVAFATMILIMLFATIWVATKEPRIAWRFVPHRNRPAPTTTPTPQVTHHAERAFEPRTHQDQQTSAPGHEFSSALVVLDSTQTAENARTITVATVRDKSVHVQLVLSEGAPSSYFAELVNSNGEVVFSEAAVAIDANAGRRNFDIPIEHLANGDFQIRLTRMSDSKQTIYFLRVK